MVDAVNAPLVPVIVSVTVPDVGWGFAFIVSAELLPLVDDGLKLPLTPPFIPVTDNVTTPEKPPVRAIVIAYVVLPFREMVRDAGVADSVNEPGDVTTNVTVVVRVRPPPVPLTVSV